MYKMSSFPQSMEPATGTFSRAVRHEGAVACINFHYHNKRRAAPDVGETASVKYAYSTVRRAAPTEGEVAGVSFHFFKGKVAGIPRSAPGKRYQ